jgi:hypothetical protein
MTKMKEAKETKKELTGYSIGPFKVDLQAETVMLSPGVYTLHIPVTFLYDEMTRVEGIHWRPLCEGDPDATSSDAPSTPERASRHGS